MTTEVCDAGRIGYIREDELTAGQVCTSVVIREECVGGGQFWVE